MKTFSSRWIVGMAACFMPALMGPLASAAPTYKLTQAVPDDVFLCVAGRHSPESEFLDAYWAEVFEALKSSGVIGDTMDLLRSFVGDEQKAEADRFKALATELIEGVDWDALCHGEALFAERWNTADIVGHSVNMGPPEMVAMFRGTDENASKNLAGFKAILKALVDEGNKAAGREILALKASSHLGIETTSLKIQVAGGQEVPFSISLAREGDVLVIVQGDKMLHDTLGLLTAKDHSGSLAMSPRFQQAFAKLPAPENALTYFDMQRMLATPRQVLEFVASERERKGGDTITNFGSCKEANKLNREALAAYKQKDFDKALSLITSAHELAPNDSLIMYNVACFQALNGHKVESLSWLEKSVDAGFYSPKQIAEDSDLETLRADPRFTAAVDKARQMAGKHDDKNEETDLAKQLIDIPGMIDYVASARHTKGHSVHCETYTALVSGAESRPLYKVFAGKKPLTDYQRFLPKETVSFSVKGMVDLTELVDFVEATIRGFGSKGEQILTKWNGLQEQFGVDLRRDLLSWLGGEFISMDVATESGDADVWMLKVKDEAEARQKLDSALQFVSSQLQQLATQNPMLAMLAVRSSDCSHERLSGFHNVQLGMSPQPAVCGVAQGYMIFGTSADAVAMALATAAGEHPNVTKNAQVMAEAVLPENGFQSISFADKRTLNKDIRKVLEFVSMGGGLAVMGIPDPKMQQAATKALGIIAKLGPVVGKIDFYKSTASCTTFGADGWRIHEVTNYREPVKTASGGY